MTTIPSMFTVLTTVSRLFWCKLFVCRCLQFWRWR